MAFGGISAALSGMQSAIVRQTISAHNVANVATPGFKSARGLASERPGRAGADISSVLRDFSQGPIQTATNAFDLAIAGEGFIPLETPSGIRYARAGVFGLDAAGTLVTPQGFRTSPPIRLPDGTSGFAVGPDGAVTAVLPDGSAQPIGQIALVRFANPQGLLDEGGGILAPGPASGLPRFGAAGTAGFGTFVSGALEGSNVDLGREMVEQILATRTFQFNAAAFRANDETLGTLLDIKQ